MITAILQLITYGLAALGVIVLVGGLVALRWYFRLRNFARKLKEELEQEEKPGPVTRLNLEPAATLPADAAAAMQPLRDQLSALGFEPAGAFTSAGMPGVSLDGWSHRQKSVLGLIAHMAKRGAWLDLNIEHAEGGSTCVSSSPGGARLNARPGHSMSYVDGATPVAEMLALCEEACGDRPRRPRDPASFAADLERQFAEEMDWRASRGGPTDEEIRRIARVDGLGASPEQLAQVASRTEEKYRAEFERRAIERMPKPDGIDGDAAEAYADGDLLWILVYDTLSRRAAEQRFLDYQLGCEWMLAEGETLAPRERFAALNARLPAGRRYKLLATLDGEPEVDVYAAPTGDCD